MQIIVKSQSEKDLFENFLAGMSELSIYHLFHTIDQDCNHPEHQYLTPSDLTLIESAMNSAEIIIISEPQTIPLCTCCKKPLTPSTRADKCPDCIEAIEFINQ